MGKIVWHFYNLLNTHLSLFQTYPTRFCRQVVLCCSCEVEHTLPTIDVPMVFIGGRAELARLTFLFLRARLVHRVRTNSKPIEAGGLARWRAGSLHVSRCLDARMATRWSAVGDTGRRARPARSISAESAVSSFAADRRVNYYAGVSPPLDASHP